MKKLDPIQSLASLMKRREQKLFAKQELAAIAMRHETTVEEITGRRRTKQAVAARLEFILWARRLKMGSPTIGRLIGRDATTVQYHSESWRPAKFARYQAKRAEAANV